MAGRLLMAAAFFLAAIAATAALEQWLAPERIGVAAVLLLAVVGTLLIALAPARPKPPQRGATAAPPAPVSQAEAD